MQIQWNIKVYRYNASFAGEPYLQRKSIVKRLKTFYRLVCLLKNIIHVHEVIRSCRLLGVCLHHLNTNHSIIFSQTHFLSQSNTWVCIIFRKKTITWQDIHSVVMTFVEIAFTYIQRPKALYYKVKIQNVHEHIIWTHILQCTTVLKTSMYIFKTPVVECWSISWSYSQSYI